MMIFKIKEKQLKLLNDVAQNEKGELPINLKHQI